MDMLFELCHSILPLLYMAINEGLKFDGGHGVGSKILRETVKKLVLRKLHK